MMELWLIFHWYFTFENGLGIVVYCEKVAVTGVKALLNFVMKVLLKWVILAESFKASRSGNEGVELNDFQEFQFLGEHHMEISIMQNFCKYSKQNYA